MPAQSRAPIILLTRPADQAARFTTALQGRFAGVAVVTSPLIAPRFLAPQVPGRVWGAVIFTSATGVEAAAGLALPKLAYCVGDQTAHAAQGAGFVARSAKGDAADLVALIVAEQPPGPLLHLSGRETRGDVAGRLTAAGIETVALVTYAQEEQPLTDAAAHLLRQPGQRVVAPVFSPRTGELLARECGRLGVLADLEIVAISPDAGRAFPPDQTTIAARPDAAAMLDAIGSRLNSAAPP